MRLEPGDRVDRYVLKHRLGEGGQGAVWQAEDPLSPGEDRAIKLVHVGSATSTQLERVRREARQLVQLQHASIVRCYGMFEDLHRELLGIVMEYVDGEPLRELVGDSRLTPDNTLLLLAHVAGALAYVHQRGVIHRDVKLENVLVTRAFWSAPAAPASVRLIDFGIAVDSTNPSPLTRIGSVIGTPAYFAPEQLEPEVWGGPRRATTTSDVFAFGVMTWKLLAGDLDAHPASIPSGSGLGRYATAYRDARARPWPPAARAAEWNAVLARALALSPADRAPDGVALVADLARVSPGQVLPTTEQTAPTPRPSAQVDQLPSETATAAPSNATPNTAVRTVLGAPPLVFGGARTASAPRERRTFAFVLGAVAMLLIGGAFIGGSIAVYILFIHADHATKPPGLVRPAPTAPAAQSPAPAPRPPAESPTEPSAPSETAYNTPNGCVPEPSMCACCPSGHDCLGAACGELMRQDDEFLLRVGGGGIGGRPLHEALPNGEICVRTQRQASRTTCTRVAYTRAGTSPPERLRIAWRDVTTDGFDIEVKDARGTVVASKIAATRGNMKRGVLCQGFIVSKLDGSMPVDRVDFFLDPLDEPAPLLCAPRYVRLRLP